MPRPQVMQHMRSSANRAIHICRQVVSSAWQHVLVTNAITDDCYVSNKTRERGYTMPLYLLPEKAGGLDFALQHNWSAGKDGRTPNLSEAFVKDFGGRLGLEFVTDGQGNLRTTFGPEDVFHYLYAVLYGSEYRSRYAEFLKIDFPIGGYQVCEKWLKDRQAKGGKNPRPGRVLTDEDIAHYQKIVVALNETIRIMKEIDEVIDQHGGWPDAFATKDGDNA